MVAFFFLIYNNRGGDYQTLQIQTYHSKKKTMTVTLNYSQLAGPNGAFFDANSSTIAQVLNTLPNAIIYTPLATPPTSDNLTFIGLFNDGSGDSVWRITNAGPAVSGVTLESTSPGFLNNSLSLTANSFTYVRSTVSGTHRLITSGVGGGTFVKADGPTIISLGNPPAPAGQTTIGRVNSNVPYNITGSNFNDTLFGGGNTDTIDGGAGNDKISGNQGNDILLGGGGDDALSGGGQNDTLIGGAGNDTLSGDGGADRFVFTNEGLDTVTVFNTTATSGLGPDVFAITSSAYLGAPAAGTLAVVTNAAAAANAASSIIVDTLTNIVGLGVTKPNTVFALDTTHQHLLYAGNDGDWTSNSIITDITTINGTLVASNFAFI